MLKTAKAFSPFASPDREHQNFMNSLERAKGRDLLGFPSGFAKMDQALDGIRGINILGGQPKAGKSCFFMQVSTEIARRKIPVIYYDFENGRQKIYGRTLCRLSHLTEEALQAPQSNPETAAALARAEQELKKILTYFRVVTDRKLNPEIMRRQLDFIRHETRQDACLVIIDSLHKLPFKNLSERRTGIDEWLRHMEAIRDEQNVAFLVVSELSRGAAGKYSKEPDLASFKESGDIEYSADNAMILQPDWDLMDPISQTARQSTLWLVASRESSPGKVAEYVLDFPYWGFREL
jgi:replicative DNA helicase